MDWKKKKKELEESFEKVHGNLEFLPDKYCTWRDYSPSGKSSPKSLMGYRNVFDFICDETLKENLAELRMALDYHVSIYTFLKPNSIFERNHKFVICQIVGAIVEGLLLDYMQYQCNKGSTNCFLKKVSEEKIKSKNLGLGYLVELYKQVKFFKTDIAIKYLQDLVALRNTVHPKSLGGEKIENNSLMEMSVTSIIDIFDNLIPHMKKHYEK